MINLLNPGEIPMETVFLAVFVMVAATDDKIRFQSDFGRRIFLS